MSGPRVEIFVQGRRAEPRMYIPLLTYLWDGSQHQQGQVYDSLTSSRDVRVHVCLYHRAHETALHRAVSSSPPDPWVPFEF